MSANAWSQRKEELLKLLQTKYTFEKVSLDISGETFALYLVSDVDALLEELLAKGETHEDVLDERIPYWADLWHSAIGMAEHVLESDAFDDESTILELGCGLGLSGIAAGKKGAKVILSDYLPEAIQVAELGWLENNATKADCRIIDWRAIDPEIKVEWVLAADVAYEERNFEPLLMAFDSLLKPGVKGLLSEPGRAIARPFLANLEQEGFSVRRYSRSVKWRGTVNTIGIYELSR
ncbi:MAG: methyltransferase [Bacteroidia bacterium]